MVSINCWTCKKNKGNRSCEIYEFIPEKAFNNCDKFDRTSREEYAEKLKNGIQMYFEGIEDPDTVE